MKIQKHGSTGSILVVEGCTALENIVLSVIRSMDYGDEFVHIKTELLAEMTGCDVSSFIRVVKSLETKGLLVCTNFKQRSKVKGYKVGIE